MTESEFEGLFRTPDVVSRARELLTERLGVEEDQTYQVLTRFSLNRRMDITAVARWYVEDVLYRTSRN